MEFRISSQVSFEKWMEFLRNYPNFIERNCKDRRGLSQCREHLDQYVRTGLLWGFLPKGVNTRVHKLLDSHNSSAEEQEDSLREEKRLYLSISKELLRMAESQYKKYLRSKKRGKVMSTKSLHRTLIRRAFVEVSLVDRLLILQKRLASASGINHLRLIKESYDRILNHAIQNKVIPETFMEKVIREKSREVSPLEKWGKIITMTIEKLG